MGCGTVGRRVINGLLTVWSVFMGKRSPQLRRTALRFPSYSPPLPVVQPSASCRTALRFPSYSPPLPVVQPSASRRTALRFPSYSHPLPVGLHFPVKTDQTVSNPLVMKHLQMHTVVGRVLPEVDNVQVNYSLQATSEQK